MKQKIFLSDHNLNRYSYTQTENFTDNVTHCHLSCTICVRSDLSPSAFYGINSHLLN